MTNQQGVTLPEVMITIAIIGMLAGIALPSYQGYIQRSTLSEAFDALSVVPHAHGSGLQQQRQLRRRWLRGGRSDRDRQLQLRLRPHQRRSGLSRAGGWQRAA